MKILELRDRAQKALGDKFDIRAFHDQVLDSGALPLDVLEQRIERGLRSAEGAASEQNRLPGETGSREKRLA